jgi:EAL domain-containing protein (putative c-di-GMP-specific phosphodiesterase class I)
MQKKHQPSRGFPLRLILIAPFVIQIVAAVGITGWLSHQNGQRIVNELASGLLVQAKYRVKERVEIAKTILALASCLGLEAIAEGVETALQLEQLQSLECLKFQGYLFAKPMSADLVLQNCLNKSEA